MYAINMFIHLFKVLFCYTLKGIKYNDHLQNIVNMIQEHYHLWEIGLDLYLYSWFGLTRPGRGAIESGVQCWRLLAASELVECKHWVASLEVY